MTNTGQFDMNAAPLRIGTVRLKVRDLAMVSAFYRNVLGLSTVATGQARVTLGAGDTPLLELEGDEGLAPLDPRQAGLFHTAFLMPSRPDLARWLAHAAGTGVSIQGASDHIVSEAIYLADPEGNGIEVYADRPAADWQTAGGEVQMATDPLDVQGLLASAGASLWQGFPEDGRIGHVHLQVGTTDAADGFYRDLLGFDIAARYPGASFYGSGGYHHQLAGNIWNSRGAPPRKPGHAGLEMLEIVVGDGERLEALAEKAAAAGLEADAGEGELRLDDPWGTLVLIRAG